MTPEAFSDLACRLGSGVQGMAVLKLNRKDQAKAIPQSDAVTAEAGGRRTTGVALVRLQGVDEGLMAEMLSAAFSEVYRPGGRPGLSDERAVVAARG